MTAGTRIRILAAVAIVLALAAAYWLLHETGAMATGELDRIMFAVLALGLLTVVPLAVHYLRERKRAASALDR